MRKNRRHKFSPYWSVISLMERAVAQISRGMRRWMARRTAAELEMLGDDVLKDIGITRAEIPALALRVTAPATLPASRYREVQYPIAAKELTT